MKVPSTVTSTNKGKTNFLFAAILFFALLLIGIHEIFVADESHHLLNFQYYSTEKPKKLLLIIPPAVLPPPIKSTQKKNFASTTTATAKISKSTKHHDDDDDDNELNKHHRHRQTEKTVKQTSRETSKPTTSTSTSSPPSPETIVVEEVVDLENNNHTIVALENNKDDNDNNQNLNVDEFENEFQLSTNVSEYAPGNFPLHPNIFSDKKRSTPRKKKIDENRTILVYPPARHYSRLAAVDATAPDLLHLPNVTLLECLRQCDRQQRCNYVVRNISFLVQQQRQMQNSSSQMNNNTKKFDSSSSSSVFNGYAGCWLKAAVVLNTYPHFERETWVISRAPQPKIAIGLLSGPKFISSRLLPALNTWLKEEDVVVILENRTEAKKEVSRIFGSKAAHGLPCDRIINKHRLDHDEKEMFLLSASSSSESSSSKSRIMFLFENEDPHSVPGAWKNMILYKKLPFAYKKMMMHNAHHPQYQHRLAHTTTAAAATPKKKNTHQDPEEPDWYFIVDDDSFVIMQTLRFLLSVSIPYEPSYTGLVMAAKDYTGGAQFIQGGAGIVLSQETFIKTLPKLDCCIELCQQSFGDFRSGCCFVHAAKISGTMHKGFYPYSPWENTGTDMRNRYGFPAYPVSFHRLRDTAMILKFQQHIDAFLTFSRKEQANTRYAGSRYRMAPGIDTRYGYLRFSDEWHQQQQVGNSSIHTTTNSHHHHRRVPINRRQWSYVDDLVPQRMMKNLKPWQNVNRPEVAHHQSFATAIAENATQKTDNNNKPQPQPADLDERVEEVKAKQQLQALDKSEQDIMVGVK